MCTLVGAEGGVTSLDASVVSATALLVEALASWSSTWTVNVYAVDGARGRRRPPVSPCKFRCWVTRAPLAKTRKVTNVEVTSSTRFQVSRTCDGLRTCPE